MMVSMAQRGQVRINLSPEGKASVDAVCDRYGMAQQEVASRIYAWFAEQDELVQASILGVLPSGLEAPAADLYMERVKAKRASGVKGSERKGPR